MFIPTQSELNATRILGGFAKTSLHQVWATMPFQPILFEFEAHWGEFPHIPFLERGITFPEDNPLAHIREIVHPHLQGKHMATILGLIPEIAGKTRKLPKQTLKNLVGGFIEGSPPVTPCHVVYLGKPLGIGLSLEQATDYMALYAYIRNLHPKLENKDGHIMSIILYSALEQTLQNKFSGVIKSVKAVNAELTKLHTAIGIPSKNTDEPGCSAIVIPYAALQGFGAANYAFWQPLLDEIDLDAMPTEDGAWMNVLDEAAHKAIAREDAQIAASAAQPAPHLAPSSPEAAEPEKLKAQATDSKPRQPKPKAPPPEAFLAGMDADTLYDEVLTNPNGYFTCEVDGPPRITPAFRTLVREGKKEVETLPSETAPGRYKRPVELEHAVAHSKLAVMEWSHFLATVDARRHPAMRWLEHLLGREINYHKADVVDITPDRIGELPGLVAGLHRNNPDRLCVVRLVMRHKTVRPATYPERQELYADYRSKRKLKNRPLHSIKTRKVSATRLLRQRFNFATPPMLAVFPAAWLSAVTEPWMPGLFGTPYDPALLDFCGTLPQEWWTEYRKVIPKPDPALRTLDLRALNSA